ncbi:glutaminase A [Paenibacillus frigoriresistens]|uniref:glutaminase A n=1 Tax=Paenibacillus alginolyticus TaxID=59839 RepID=UPI00156655A4|nr:glutaminase A [Paenibacillus frigoriresistens]NRF90290.1 glutaminase A [Paenibacillus frigoriresistens]
MSHTQHAETWKQLKEHLPQWVTESKAHTSDGQVASYIPELANAPADVLGICIMDAEGNIAVAGESNFRFTLQSISKVFTLILALMDNGEEVVFSKVGMEPTGDDFNSMLKLELVEPGIPFNPLINAGAIAISSLIAGSGPREQVERILHFFRDIANNPSLEINQSVFQSESDTAHRNRSLAYFLKDNGVLDSEVDDVLHVYFSHCSVEVNCTDLARLALVLAHNGVDPIRNQRLIPRRFVQIAKTFMFTCGMYNASGEFAMNVGLPAKSGVSGSILTMVPGQYGIGLVGPALNRKGNSTAGVHLLGTLSQEFDWSLF